MAIYFIIAVVALLLIGKLLAWPLKILIKLVINALAGAVLIFLVNLVGGGFGIGIPLNAITALIVGFLGVPGVIFLIIYNALM